MYFLGPGGKRTTQAVCFQSVLLLCELLLRRIVFRVPVEISLAAGYIATVESGKIPDLKRERVTIFDACEGLRVSSFHLEDCLTMSSIAWVAGTKMIELLRIASSDGSGLGTASRLFVTGRISGLGTASRPLVTERIRAREAQAQR